MITIDAALCDGCGICGRVCPRYVPELVEQDGRKVSRVVAERRNVCLDCGQCALVCKKDAIRVDGLPPEAIGPIPPSELGPDQLMDLFAQRRSTRRFKDKPVPREVLERIVDAVRYAPPAAGRPCVGVIIIDRPDALKEVSRLCYSLYAQMMKGLENPIGRFIIKRKVRRAAGEQRLAALLDFVMPGMKWYRRWYEEGRSDEIRRDSPVLMLFHAPKDAPAADESCLIAAMHAVYMAQTLGVGTLVNGLIPPPCNKVPALRALLGLPEDREVQTALSLGYPKYKYLKTVRRPLAEVRFLD